MRLTNFLYIFALILLSCSCTPTTKIRHHADYKTVIAKAREVTILPPVAEVNTVSLSGKKERMYDYETHLEQVIIESLTEAIKAKGYKVKFLSKRNIHEAKLGRMIASLRDKYNIIREELYKPLQWEEKKAFSIEENIGRSILELNQEVNSDLIIIVDYVGIVKTTSARTFDFATSILLGSNLAKDADNSSMIIGIIEAKSGNVLWTNVGAITKDIYSCAFDNFSDQSNVEKENINGLITQALPTLKH